MCTYIPVCTRGPQRRRGIGNGIACANVCTRVESHEIFGDSSAALLKTTSVSRRESADSSQDQGRICGGAQRDHGYQCGVSSDHDNREIEINLFEFFPSNWRRCKKTDLCQIYKETMMTFYQSIPRNSNHAMWTRDYFVVEIVQYATDARLETLAVSADRGCQCATNARFLWWRGTIA